MEYKIFDFMNIPTCFFIVPSALLRLKNRNWSFHLEMSC